MKKVSIIDEYPGLGPATIRLMDRHDLVFVVLGSKPNMRDFLNVLRAVFKKCVDYIYIDPFVTNISIFKMSVDEVTDASEKDHFDKMFVGRKYKGLERFFLKKKVETVDFSL